MVPVLGGIVLFAVIGGLMWGIAAFISRGGSDATERLAPNTFEIGNVVGLAETVANSGPLLFPELGTAIGTRSIVVDHTGSAPDNGWRVYWAYPADRDASCVVEQVPGTADFIDCDGRTIDVSKLSPPDAGVFPTVRDRTTLLIDLRRAARISTP